MRITRKIKARPVTWWSWNHVIQEGTNEITVLQVSPFYGKAVALIEDEQYEFNREGQFRREFTLRSTARTLVTAKKTSIFRTVYAITGDGIDLELKRTSFWKGSFGLFEKAKEIGSITRESFFSRLTILKIPQDISNPVSVFLFWLVLLSRRRRSRRR